MPCGDVLRCHITECGEGEDGPVAIYIDDKEYSLHEFGELLRMYAGWGMRPKRGPLRDEAPEKSRRARG